MKRLILTLLFALPLAACHSGAGEGGKTGVPGDPGDRAPWHGVADGEVLRFTGTEPFWGGTLAGGTFTYTTPADPAGRAITVSRFSGRGGMGLSGSLDGKPFDLTVTPGDCSDGMSDRRYPFTVLLNAGGEARNGCAWSEAHPFTGPAAP